MRLAVHFLAPLLKTSGAASMLCIEGREPPLATVLETAFDSASRNRGLLGRDGLADGSALVIAPGSAIHTFGMRFPIDVIFAARDGRVLKLRRAIPSARLSMALRSFAVIEMAAGSIDRAALAVGDRLVVRPVVDIL
jgi:uncharacterized membrane protein (UPF0127 family)